MNYGNAATGVAPEGKSFISYKENLSETVSQSERLASEFESLLGRIAGTALDLRPDGSLPKSSCLLDELGVIRSRLGTANERMSNVLAGFDRLI